MHVEYQLREPVETLRHLDPTASNFFSESSYVTRVLTVPEHYVCTSNLTCKACTSKTKGGYDSVGPGNRNLVNLVHVSLNPENDAESLRHLFEKLLTAAHQDICLNTALPGRLIEINGQSLYSHHHCTLWGLGINLSTMNQ